MADQSNLPWEGWRRSYVPIHVGEPSPEGVSLRQLGEAESLAAAVDRIAVGFDSEKLYAALTALHYAVGAVAELLIAPYALDGVVLDVQPANLGIELDKAAGLTSLWVQAAVAPLEEATATRLGCVLVATVAPVSAAVSTLTGTPPRALTLVVADAIERACRRLERAYPCRPEHGWIASLLVAVGDPDRPARRTFSVTPDAGQAIEMGIPRVCCVLATASGEHACPTCPQRSVDDRRATTEAWLQSLDAFGFRSETGRAPVRVSS